MFDQIEVVVPPVEEPVFLQDAIDFIHGIQDGQEARFQECLIAARSKGESYTRRSFVTQTIDVWYSNPDGVGYFDLPRGKVQSLVSITTYDPYDVPSMLDITGFALSGSSLVYSVWAWPTAYRIGRGIKIRLISGYGDPEDVPADIKTGIMMYANHLYERRLGEPPDAQFSGQVITGTLPPTVVELWHPYKLILV